MSNRSPRTDTGVLPAITLDVTPTPPGLRHLAAQLETFAQEHDLPADVATRLVAVASDVAEVLTAAVESPPLGRLQADADIAADDAQLVLIAGDHRLPDRYPSLRGRLERLSTRCDEYAAQLTPSAEIQVWARFRR